MSAPPDPPAIATDPIRAGLRDAGLQDDFRGYELSYLGRFSNDIWRMDLDNGVRLVVKQGYRAARPGERPDAERRFYRLMANRNDLPIPRFVADLDGVLVLEHLQLEHFSFQAGVRAGHVDAAIDALADWHAAFWDGPPRQSWLPDLSDRRVRESIQSRYDAAWRRHRTQLVEYAPGFGAIGDALAGRLAATLEPLAQPATLIHGDAHAENVPLADGRAWLLDWQDPQIANPGLDLAVFTTMSFRRQERAGMEGPLVVRYLERLESHGCHWPDAWQSYRLGLLRRAARIVEIAGTGFGSLPWVFGRSAVAAVQHHVEELIR